MIEMKDIIRAIIVVKVGGVDKLIFFKDGIPEEFDFIGHASALLVDALIDEVKKKMIVFSGEVMA